MVSLMVLGPPFPSMTSHSEWTEVETLGQGYSHKWNHPWWLKNLRVMKWKIEKEEEKAWLKLKSFWVDEKWVLEGGINL